MVLPDSGAGMVELMRRCSKGTISANVRGHHLPSDGFSIGDLVLA